MGLSAPPWAGEGMYGDMAGELGDPCPGDQAGLKLAGLMPLASLAPLGENPGPPGVIPEPSPPGDQAPPP